MLRNSLYRRTKVVFRMILREDDSRDTLPIAKLFGHNMTLCTYGRLICKCAHNARIGIISDALRVDITLGVSMSATYGRVDL